MKEGRISSLIPQGGRTIGFFLCWVVVVVGGEKTTTDVDNNKEIKRE